MSLQCTHGQAWKLDSKARAVEGEEVKWRWSEVIWKTRDMGTAFHCLLALLKQGDRQCIIDHDATNTKSACLRDVCAHSEAHELDDWIIATHCCMACLKGWCVVYNRSRTLPRDLLPARGAVTTARRSYDSSTGCPCVNEWPSRSPSWSFSVWPARHRRTWQTTVSSPPTSARADSDQPTQRRASSEDQITVSATGVLRLLDHVCTVCGTCCQSIYGCVTVLNSLNGCSRLICLVLEIAALCDALVRSAVYK